MNLTVVIKTLLRPDSVRKTVQSFSNILGEHVPIIVVDDSPTPNGDGFPPQVHYVKMQYDSGLSAGRNMGVCLVNTPYVFIVDDDCVLQSSRDEVVKCVQHLKDGWDIVGSGAYRFEPDGKRLIVRECPLVTEFLECEITFNFFVAKVEVLKSVPWDAAMKVQPEHADHFLRLKEAKAKVLGTRLLRFNNSGAGNQEYRKLRQRSFINLFEKKHGYNEVKWKRCNDFV
jgi:glycosyltransferase involved in cell wall biosynthesis